MLDLEFIKEMEESIDNLTVEEKDPSKDLMMDLFIGHKVHVDRFLSKSSIVIGQSGSGKTNTIAVILEEFIRLRVPFMIIDPEGEYHTLQRICPQMVVFNDTNLTLDSAKDEMRNCFYNKIPFIIDGPEIKDPRDFFIIVNKMMEELWNLKLKHPKIPYMFIMEECHLFVPQSDTFYIPKGDGKKLKMNFKNLARRGRKKGIGGIYATQRVQEVDKTIYTQCVDRILHKVDGHTEFTVYNELLPLTPKQVQEEVPSLGKGEVFYRHEGEGSEAGEFYRLWVRRRHTFHVSDTPGSGNLGGEYGKRIVDKIER